MQILFIHSLQERHQETSFKLCSALKIMKEKKQSIVMFWLRLANVCVVGFQESLGIYLRRALSGKKFTTTCH